MFMNKAMILKLIKEYPKETVKFLEELLEMLVGHISDSNFLVAEVNGELTRMRELAKAAIKEMEKKKYKRSIVMSYLEQIAIEQNEE